MSRIFCNNNQYESHNFYNNLKWNLSVRTESFLSSRIKSCSVDRVSQIYCDAVVYCAGGIPINPFEKNIYSTGGKSSIDTLTFKSLSHDDAIPFLIYSLDSMVDPNYVKLLLDQFSDMKTKTWAVVGIKKSL